MHTDFRRSLALSCLALGALAVTACGGGGGGGGGGTYGIGSRVPVTTLTFPTGSLVGALRADDYFPSLPAFASPVAVAHAPGDDTRLFVLEQRGRIRVFSKSPTVTAYTTFLDATSIVTSAMGEEGLLGLAFHPQYATNRAFYVYYTAADAPRRSVVSRFLVSTVNPNVADPNSESIVLEIPQPYPNHNAGWIGFDAAGDLYVSLGDGGDGGDPGNRAQNTNELLGKMLRISVNPTDPPNTYGIPATNPFATSTTSRPEIFAWGLRNPWRCSFDRSLGTLWCGDVGQGAREEIDVVTLGGNYGWRAYEGTKVYSSGDTSNGPFVAPILDYGRSTGTTVVGGCVYRGTAIPALQGTYVYADYTSGRVWGLTTSGGVLASNTELFTASNPSAFGEDASGEMYLCEHSTGRVKRIVPSTPGAGGVFPELLSETGIFSDLATLTPNAGIVEYDVNVPLWSDGASKHRLLALPGSERIGWSRDGRWTFPVGTCLVKTFEVPLVVDDPSSAVRVETRVLLRTTTAWEGYCYRWRDDGTDADLLPAGDTRTLSITDPLAPGGVRDQTWTFPSRTDCLRCHTEAAGRVLGLDTRQMNRDFDYHGVVDNQLRSLAHAGYFSGSVPSASTLPAHPVWTDVGASLASRARAYLEVNCAMCHRPGGPSGGTMDLRSTVSVAAMNVVGVAPVDGSLGLPAPLRVDSGDRLNSILWLRMTRLDGTRMPPLASSLVDDLGRDVVGAWIDSGP